MTISINSSAVQSWMAGQVATYLESELNVKIRIERVHFNFYDNVTMEGFYVEDMHGDTLLYVEELNCKLEKLDFEARNLILSEVTLNSAVVGIKQYEGEEDLNFQFLVDYFEDKDTVKSKHPWKANLRRVKLNGADFSFHDLNKESKEFGVDFDDIHLRDLTLNVADFHQNADTTFFKVDELGFKDQSGFVLSNISTKASVSDKQMQLMNFKLVTEYSNISTDQLTFDYKSFDDFDDFENRVRINSQIYPSILHMSDLAYFVPDLEGIYLPVHIQAKVKGKVNNLKIRDIELRLSDSVYFRGDFAIEGLPDFENALMAIQIDDMKANRSELIEIELPPYDGTSFLELPFNFDYFGQINGHGDFLGTINDFVAYAEVHTEIGSLKTDIHFVKDEETKRFRYKGDLIPTNFNMGTFFENEKLGSITANLNINATGFDIDDLQAQVKGLINEVSLVDYVYHDITIDGKFSKEFYDGIVELKDPNLNLKYDGYVNFGRKPSYFFTATIRNAAINKIHLAELTGLDFFNRDESTVIDATMKWEAEGNSLNDFRGKINIWDLAIDEKGEHNALQYIKLTARNVNRSTDKMFELASPQFFISATGNYTFDNIIPHINNIAASFAPTYIDKIEFKQPVNESFKFEANLIDVKLYSKLFFPELEIADRTAMEGHYSAVTGDFNFEFYSNFIRYEDMVVDDLSMKGAKADSTGKKINLYLSAGNFNLASEGISYQNIDLKVKSTGDFLETDLKWKNKDGSSEGNLVNDILIKSPNQFLLVMKPSYASLEGKKWHMQDTRDFIIDSSRIEIKNEVRFSNGRQAVSFQGVIANNNYDQMNFKIEKFNMNNFSYMNEDSSRVDFFGEINGYGFVKNVYENLVLENDLQIDSLGINKELVGDLIVKNTLEPLHKRIHSSGNLIRKGIPALNIDGYYYLEEKENSLDYSLKFKETNLVFLNAFLPSDISNFVALATGEINITGKPEKPDLKGSLLFENGAIKVNMLNTSYFFGGKVNIDYDMIYFDRMPIEDVRGHKASANGTIIHHYFENWNYDFTMDFEKLLCLNTNEEQNNLYFGKAYASGDLEVEGYGDKINIEVRAKSEKGTKVVLPLYGASEISVSDFVTFVTDDTTQIQEKEVSLEGITLNFDLDVTPDAEVKIVFNKTAGDEMVGRGQGHISMIIDPLGDFNMYGNYVVEDAFYRFTLLDVINKNFTVKKGGTINWYGDPYNADLNLQAIYKVKTSLYDIMPPDIADDYRKARDVNCVMNFKNSLYSPEISFDIDVPKADENARSMINSIRSSEQELSKQFFALLVMNKFMPLGGSSNKEHTTASAFSTPSELLSSQLSNWLSQISDEFDIGVNYRPGTNITGEQIEVAFSTQFFDDRVTVSTNVGVSQGSAVQPSNQIIGDFNVEVKIGEEGNMRVRGFNESNQYDIANVTQAPFTQGVGVFYTEEFDKISETKTLLFIRSLFNKEAREERKRMKAEKKERKKQREADDAANKVIEDDTQEEE